MLAMQTVEAALQITRAIERSAPVAPLTKPDASPVTVADFSVQGLVAARLSHHFASDDLVAEEDADALRRPGGADLRARVLHVVRQVDPAIELDDLLDGIDRGRAHAGRRFWALDPVDGTKGLLRGGQYVIALALVVDGVVELGVLGCPRLSGSDGGSTSPEPVRGEGGLAVAVRGRGSWWSASGRASLSRLSVSGVDDPKKARVLRSFEAAHGDVARFDRTLVVLGVDTPPILMDSQAKHVVLAGGRADLLLRFPAAAGGPDAIWDQAAGSLMVEEAGGRVTDLGGHRLDFSAGRHLRRNDGVVASNGLLHDAVLDAVRSS
jgi:3'(2'), 5'-bisphosphate nucleotidase